MGRGGAGKQSALANNNGKTRAERSGGVQDGDILRPEADGGGGDPDAKPKITETEKNMTLEDWKRVFLR